ncbi:MAG: hypothetical protein WCI20_11390 [bacterium]
MKRRWIMRIGMLIVAIHMGAVATQADETVPSKEPPNLVTNVAERVRTLKANLPSVFEMHLWPNLSNVEKPFYALTLTTRPVPGDNRPNPFVRRVQVTREQAGKIIDYLAVEGFLAWAVDRENPPEKRAKWPEGYVLGVSTCPSGLTSLVEPLGWDGKMLKRLDGLRKVLEGDAAKEMDLLLGRLSGLRSAWEEQAAAEQSGGPANGADLETIRWGTPVNGLQLGIAPPVSKNGVPEAIFDGHALRVRVFCRNAGAVPVRLLASVHTCLLGEGGNNALLASELTLTPKDGGKTISVAYQGWNHLSLLDKRRPKDKQPQATLNDSLGGKTDIQLSEEDAKRMTTVLAPGETGPVTGIYFEPWKKPRSWWWFKRDTDTVTAGTYRVTATFKVDQELSEWKGEVTSPALEVEIGQPAGQFIAYLKPKIHDKGPCDYYLVGDEATARKAAAQEIGKYLATRKATLPSLMWRSHTPEPLRKAGL